MHGNGAIHADELRTAANRDPVHLDDRRRNGADEANPLRDDNSLRGTHPN
jgi:hypothetical protein